MTYENNKRISTLRATLMAGVMATALPMVVFAADATTPQTAAVGNEERVTASVPPAPQGPFFSRRMVSAQNDVNSAGFPPMGFDPMASTSPAAPVDGGMPQAPAYPGNAYGNTLGGGSGADTGGETQVDIQVRGRIGLGGRGAGQQGWGNNFMHGMPYGMPYGQGYGAPYGTPFNQHAYSAPQYAPGAVLNEKPGVVPTPAPAVTQQPQPAPGLQQPNLSQQRPQGYQAPFTWAPQGMDMSNPGGFFTRPQASQAPVPQGQVLQAPQASVQPEEPQWVKDRRAEAEKRRVAAEQRYADMQKNNPYARQGSGQGYGQGYGQPYGQGYGAPYGAPFANPYGYAPRYAPQAPAVQSPAPEATENVN